MIPSTRRLAADRSDRAQRRRPRPIPGAIVALLAWASILPGAARADETDTTNLIDWYYAAAFGTGAYKIGDKRAAVFRISPSFTLQEVGPDQVGLKLLLPMSVGLFDFGLSKVLDEDLSEKVGMVSFLPGFEYQIQRREGWLLKPFVQLGGGVELSGGGRALIYALGLRNRTSWWRGRTEYVLGAELKRAGYETSDGTTSTLSRAGIGGNVVWPLHRTFRGRELNWGVHAIYRRYFNAFDTLVPEISDVDTKRIVDEIELAATIGTYQPFSLLGFRFERLGLGVTFGQNLRGIKLITGFPF